MGVRRIELGDIIEQYDLEGTKDPEVVTGMSDEEYAASEIDLETTFQELLTTGARVAPNLKIDDRGLKEFPNFYSFCMSPDGIDQAPFAKQLAIATHLFGEWCPRCSKKAFRNIANVPVDADVTRFHRNVTLLEYGVCPKCGGTRSDFYLEHELYIYKALVGVAGQRCVTADTLLYTAGGIIEFGSLDTQLKYGYSKTNLNVHTGTQYEEATQIYKAKEEILRTLKTSGGHTIRGTKDHPIYMFNGITMGYITLGNVEVGHKVPVYIGTNCFGHLNLDVYDPSILYVPKITGQLTKAKQIEFLSKYISARSERIKDGIYIEAHRSVNLLATLLLNLGVPNFIKGSGVCVTANATRALAALVPLDIDLTEFYNIPKYTVTKLNGALVYYEDVVDIDTSSPEETYDLLVPGPHCFIANGLLNHNSGKSALLCIASPYITHKWLKVPSPVKTLGLMKNSILMSTFVGLTYAKACFAAGTQISMADGSKKAIENISPGDKVKTFEGESVVNQLFDNGIHETLTVTINGKKIHCTPDHKFRVYDKDSHSLTWVEAKDLKEDDLVVTE